MGEASEKVPNVPKVPNPSSTACNESDSPLGTFGGEVPSGGIKDPKVPHSGLDLADFLGDRNGQRGHRS